MTRRFDAAIFDLDGTLADTLADIASAANHALTQLGHEPIELPRYRYLAGQGLRWLMEHALDDAHQHQVDEGMALFKAYYAEHDRDQTRPNDGVVELLDALRERALKLAVLSNKPHEATVRVVSEMFEPVFDEVMGAKEGVPLKPDPASANALCAALGVEPARVMYVGDTKVDMQTAKNAGFYAVGVLWGFRDEDELRANGADAIIAQANELIDLL